MFLNKIRNIFCGPDTKFVSATNVVRAGKRGNSCVGNNVTSFARALNSFLLKMSRSSVSMRSLHGSDNIMPLSTSISKNNF